VEVSAEVKAEVGAEVVVDILADVLVDVFADVLVELASGTGLEVWVKTRQPKELEVFNSLRLSIVVAAEITAEVIIAAEAIIG